MTKPRTPAQFFDALPDDQVALAEQLRSAVLKAAPRAEQVVRFGWLFFEAEGPVCFIQSHSRHLNLGFWRGALLPDPESLLEGSGKHQRHIKVRRPDDIKVASIGELVRAAAKLNRDVPYT